MGKFGKEDYNEQMIVGLLSRFMLSNPKYIIENLYVFDWESDLLLVTNSGYYYEFEVKITLSDFKRDFDKTAKHQIMRSGKKESRSYRKVNGKVVESVREYPRKRPNYFFYAVPYYLEEKVSELVPEYAGLVVIDEGGHPITRKKAPKLHSDKNDINLQDKFYHNWRNAKSNNERLTKEIRMLNEKLRIPHADVL